jgi:hypothetical protein
VYENHLLNLPYVILPVQFRRHSSLVSPYNMAHSFQIKDVNPDICDRESNLVGLRSSCSRRNG